ncbi:uncharacterized protein LOC106657738 [Trichogramma pretiosum]|uniref:uncharacterized protein LOC106657738 n=1 Tax=Trichogramma pretiosum TaxID=7493 RepID=UPI0006C9D772|nr:uncharacterized protein LOC106657738 [Trichogramma pretiosum]
MGSLPTRSAFVVTVFLFTLCCVEISAKRGCSAFGHSCYGGHGKRSNIELTDFNEKNKDEVQEEYDLAKPNLENVAYVPSQGFTRDGFRLDNRAIDRLPLRLNPNSWSLFIKKLMTTNRHPYMTYGEVQK